MNRFSFPFYRDTVDTLRWKTSRVQVESSDLYIRSTSDICTYAEHACRSLREIIRNHITIQPDFLSSLTPLKRIHDVPDIIFSMYTASEGAQVGPMASVAGAIAEFTGRICKVHSEEIIIENGGDIWLSIKEPVLISIYSGRSDFKNGLYLRILPEDTPMGICTSSGTVGHSLSFGKAESVSILSRDTSLADAVATAACNMVQTEDYIQRAVEYSLSVQGITGAVIIKGNKLAAMGNVEFVDHTDNSIINNY
ncbi:MAG TPA: UPF0280 family protein [Spirochaetota bacterium]|nr:UPF0280 family protein [Spirochaetota bacterium]